MDALAENVNMKTEDDVAIVEPAGRKVANETLPGRGFALAMEASCGEVYSYLVRPAQWSEVVKGTSLIRLKDLVMEVL